MLLAQTFPLTSQNVDKFLSLDLPSMVVFLAVIIGLTLLASSYFHGRSQLQTDQQSSVVIKFFTDDNSPMVISSRQQAENSKRVAEALEMGNKNSAELTLAIVTLGKKTDEQTGELGKQTAVIETLNTNTNAFSVLISKDLSVHAENISELTKSNMDVNAKIDQLIIKVDQVIKDKQDCMELRGQLDAFKAEFTEKMNQQAKRQTHGDSKPIPVVNLPVEVVIKSAAPETAGLN